MTFVDTPFGPITFTGLSTKAINIQVEKWGHTGQYERFTVTRDNRHVVCSIAVHGALDDCTDWHAKRGRNLYNIGAKFHGGSFFPRDFYADTLQEDRTFTIIPPKENIHFHSKRNKRFIYPL